MILNQKASFITVVKYQKILKPSFIKYLCASLDMNETTVSQGQVRMNKTFSYTPVFATGFVFKRGNVDKTPPYTELESNCVVRTKRKAQLITAVSLHFPHKGNADL